MRRAWLALVVLFTAAALFEAGHSRLLNLPHQLSDFRAFYCGGAAVNAHGDPYHVQPVSACEHATTGLFVMRNPTVTFPVTLPGYDIPVFRLLAMLPFFWAAVVWTLLEVVAVGTSIWLLCRLCSVHPAFVTAALALSLGLASITQGQLMPFEVLAIVATVYALERGREAWTGIFAVCTCIEPHIGLPICASLVLFRSRVRVPVASGFVVLLAVTIACIGPAEAIEYARGVMGAQVASEASYQEQLSFTYVLALGGMAKPLAVHLGTLSYALASAIGIAAGRLLAVRRGLGAALIFAPAAASVIGGPYVHITQIAATIPLAILLYPMAGKGLRADVLALSTALLAIPWSSPYASKQLYLITLLACATILCIGVRGRRLAWRIATVCAFAIMLNVLENRPRIVNPPIPVRAYDPSALAQVSWTDYTAARETHDGTFFFLKVLTWLGLLGLCIVTYRTIAAAPGRLRAG